MILQGPEGKRKGTIVNVVGYPSMPNECSSSHHQHIHHARETPNPLEVTDPSTTVLWQTHHQTHHPSTHRHIHVQPVFMMRTISQV